MKKIKSKNKKIKITTALETSVSFFNFKITRGVLFMAFSAMIFFVSAHSVEAAVGSFTQNNWTGGTNSTVTNQQSGWTAYDPASDGAYLETSPSSVVLKKETGPKNGNTLDSTRGNFSGGTSLGGNTALSPLGTSASDLVDLTLERKGNELGVVTVGNYTGQTTSIAHDASDGLHVLYHNSSDKKLYYLYSNSYGATWVGPTLIQAIPDPSTPDRFGEANALAIDVDNNRLYAVFNAEKDGTGGYKAVQYATCSFVPKSGCAANSWIVRKVEHLAASGALGTFVSIAITKSSAASASPLVHIAATGNGNGRYYNCVSDAGSSHCTTVSEWSNALTFNASRVVGISAFSRPGPAYGHRIYLAYWTWSGGTTVTRRAYYRTCDATSPANCSSSNGWTQVQLDSANTATGGSSAVMNASGAISQDGQVHIVYPTKDTLKYRVLDTLHTITTTDSIASDVYWNESSDYLGTPPVRITLDNDSKPYVVYGSSRGQNGLAAVTVARRVSASSWIPTGTQSTCGNDPWSCLPQDPVRNPLTNQFEVPTGGFGLALALIPGDAGTPPVPAITHFTSSSGAGQLRYLATLFATEGEFTSRSLNAGSPSTWKDLVIKTKSPANIVKLDVFARSGGDGPVHISSGQGYCKLATFDLSPSGPVRTGGDSSKIVIEGQQITIKLESNGGIVGQGANCPINQGSQYLQYRLALYSNSSRSATPIIDEVKAVYENYPAKNASNNPVSLLSSRFNMGLLSDGPIIRTVSWRYSIPTTTPLSQAKVALQIRSSSSTTFPADPTANWYGSGGSLGGRFESWVDNTTGTPQATNGCVGPTLISGTTYAVSCPVDASSPVNTNASHFQYRLILESTNGATTPTVYEVKIEYATNNRPVVTMGTPSQAASGVITVPYTVTDLEDSTFDIALFYDVGLRVASTVDSAGTSIAVTSGGLQLSALIPSEGVLMINYEQIKYRYISGNLFTTQPITNITLERGAYLTSADQHAVGDVVWVRATDAVVASDFGRTAHVGGHVGAVSGTGSKVLTWNPSAAASGRDVPGSVYMIGKNLMVSANDRQAVKQVGRGVVGNDFTLDTKAPVFTGNPLNITGQFVKTINGKLKTSNTAVTLSIASLAHASGTDNASGNRMAFCNSAMSECGVPTALNLLAGAGWGGWTTLTNFASTHPFNLMNQQVKQKINIAVIDPAGNITTGFREIVVDTTAPPMPANFTAEDISNDAVGALVYLRWADISASEQLKDGYGDGDFLKFKIYRAVGSTPPSTTGAPHAELSSATQISFVDTTVVNGTTYTYRLVVEDNVNNVSTPTAAGPLTPSTVGAPPPPPPVLSNVRCENRTTNSVVVKWNSDIPSDSKVVYAGTSSKPPSFEGYPSQGLTAYNTDHAVTVAGLSPTTTYYFELRSAAPGNNVPGTLNTGSTTGCNSGADFSVTTLTPPPVITPLISGVSITISHNSATVGWTTNIDADSFVVYGTDPGLGSTSTILGQRDSLKTHSVQIANLQPQSTYYFRINSTAGEGTGVAPSVQQPVAGGANFSCSQSSCSFLTAADPNDTTAPQYSNIQVSGIQHNTATVTWNTDEPATAFVEFWKSGDLAHRFWPPTPSTLKTAHTVQLPFDLTPETDYNFRVISADASNNSIPSNQQTPFRTAQEPSVVVAPAFTGPTIRHDTITATSATIYFRTDQPTDARILYSANGQSYNEQQYFAQLVNDHTVTLVNLTPATTYYYKVRATNSSDLQTESTDCGGQLCAFTTLATTSPVPQVIPGSLQVTQVTANQATISWTTTIAGNSLVEFGPADESGNPLYGRTFGYSTKSVTAHSVTLPNDLLSNQIYYFRVRTRDSSDQLVVYPGTVDASVYAAGTCPGVLNELHPCFKTVVSEQILISELATPPIISGVGALLVTDSKAVIGWSTDKLASSEVNYGVSTTYGANRQPLNAQDQPVFTRTHAVTLDGLQPKTKYYFKVSSVSLLPPDLQATDDNGAAGYSFTTLSTAVGQSQEGQGQDGALKDTVPPFISAVTVNDISNDSARITWATNEQATSVVQYGETVAYGDLAGDYSTFVTSHSVQLKNLNGGTEYHFLVVSYDIDGNRGQGSNMTFKTTGEKTEKKDKDGEGDNEKDNQKKGDDELDEATKKILELSEDKKLSVEKIMELLQEFSEEDVAKILASIGIQLVSPPRFVGGVPRVEVTTTTATISWQTDKESDSRVAYVKQDGYRPQRDEPYQTETGETQVFSTSHVVSLIGLEPNTTYHYQLRSRERAGRTARSIDRVFKTLPLKPEVTGARVASATENTATLTWKTNVPTKAVVEYVNTRSGEKRSQGDPQFFTTHQFSLKNLDADTAYTATVRSEDETGASATSSAIGFRTTRDNVKPEILQVRTDVSLSADKADLAQAIITWRTNEPATSQVLYEEGITQSPDLKNATPLQQEYLMNHVIVLNKLRSATPYRFRVVSVDAAGNKTVSRDYTLLTPQKKETVVEIIIKNFEDAFGFLKGFGK